MLQKNIKVQCPYCGYTRNTIVEIKLVDQFDRTVINCTKAMRHYNSQNKEVGCAQDFIVYFKPELTIDIKTISGCATKAFFNELDKETKEEKGEQLPF